MCGWWPSSLGGRSGRRPLRQNILIFGENVVMAKTKQKKNSGLKEYKIAFKTNIDVYQKSKKENSVLRKDEISIIHWLGEKAIAKNQIHSDFDLFHASAEGLPKSSVDKLAGHLGISRKSMAEDVLDLSVKTLERKAAADKLDRRTSSHVLEIAKVMQHAYEVFEDEEKVKRWVNKENRALNGMKPVQLFATLTGINMVNDILGRIEEGVYS